LASFFLALAHIFLTPLANQGEAAQRGQKKQGSPLALAGGPATLIFNMGGKAGSAQIFQLKNLAKRQAPMLDLLLFLTKKEKASERAKRKKNKAAQLKALA
jgi:hypothetical protein